MELVNDTPFPSMVSTTLNHKNEEFYTIVSRVKYLFDFIDSEGLWSLKFDKDQGRLFRFDVPYGDKNKKIRFESDYIAYKKQADLIINLAENRTEYGTCGVEVIRYTSPTYKDTLLKHMSMKHLGFIPSSDKSRTQWVGTIDDKWIKNDAPYFPKDFNERYYNAAHPKMQLANKYFEPGDIIHFHKLLYGEHKQSVMIPGVYLTATVIGQGEFSMLLEADTVVFDIQELNHEKNCIYISYRNRIPKNKQINNIKLKMMLEKAFIA